MDEVLVALNQLILTINQKPMSLNEMKAKCEEMEELLPQVKGFKSSYKIYLAEVYSVKLCEYGKAIKLCNQLTDDFKDEIIVEAYLRLSFIKYLQNEFSQAVYNYEKAFSKAGKMHQFVPVIQRFVERIFPGLDKDSIAKAFKKQFEQDFDHAITIYQKQLSNRSGEAKYFAAKALLQIQSSKMKRSDLQSKSFYQELMQEIIEDIEKFQDGDRDMASELNDKYINKKLYVSKIFQCYNEGIKVNTISRKKTVGEAKLQKMMAHLKLMKAITTAKNEKASSKTIDMLENCVRQLDSSKYNSLLGKFIELQMKKFSRMLVIGDDYEKTQKYQAFQAIRQAKVSKQIKSTHFKMEQASQATKYSPGNKIKRTHSDVIVQEDDFEGSYMIKVNATSNGYEKRYFHIIRQEIDPKNFKLYYADKKTKKSKDNDAYKLHTIRKIKEGKQSDALKRSQCDNFQEKRCFTVVLEDKERSFYVEKQSDFIGWMRLLYWYMQMVKSMKKTKNQGKKKQSDSPNKQKQTRSKAVLMQ